MRVMVQNKVAPFCGPWCTIQTKTHLKLYSAKLLTLRCKTNKNSVIIYHGFDTKLGHFTFKRLLQLLLLNVNPTQSSS